MKQEKIFSYGLIPRGSDRAKAYLYFREWADRLFEFKGVRCGGSVVRVVLLACVNNGYVEGSAKLLGVCGQTVRNHLKYQDPLRFLQVNCELVELLKKLGAFSKPLTLAIDWHDVMYYGNPEAQGVVGTQPKKGSHYAYRFATASVLLHGERLTLAVAPICGVGLLDQVKQLINCVQSLGVKIRIVLFDRGYFSAELINYLNSQGLKYIIQLPAVIKGLSEGEDFIYTTRSCRRPKNEQATFRLVTFKAKDKGGKDKLFIFATNTSLKPKRIRKLFKKRWGIETSYRMIRQFQAKTTSKLYTLRKLYFYLAVLLYNIWVLLNFKKTTGITAYTLRLHITLCLCLQALTNMEAGQTLVKQE
jgi:hypothetical protein